MNTNKITPKQNKSAAIVGFGTCLTLQSINVRSVDLIYTREYLLNVLEREKVDYVSKVLKNDSALPFYKDIEQVDLNDYDEVYIYNASLNPFGGLFKEEALITFEKLYDFKGDIYYMLIDPKMPPISFASFLMYKNKLANKPTNKYVIPCVNKEKNNQHVISKEIVEGWNEKVWKRMAVAHDGVDYELYYNFYNIHAEGSAQVFKKIEPIKNWFQFNLVEYYAINENLKLKMKNYEKTGKYDLVYFGNNRQNERNKIIQKYYDIPEMNKLFIGFDPELSNTTVEKYLKHEDLFRTMCTDCLATLVIGDHLHSNDIRSARFFECMLLDIVGFIDINYDKDKKFIKNEFLKDFIYVSSKSELKEKIKKIKEDPELYRKIVDLERRDILEQFKSLFRYSNNTVDALNKLKKETAPETMPAKKLSFRLVK